MYPNQPNQDGYPQQPTPLTTGKGAPLQQNSDGHYTVLPPLNNSGGASGHNPYEFIMSPNSKKHALGLGGASFAKQITLIGSGAVLLIILLVVGFSLFAPKGNTASVLAVAQRQQEIVRIAESANRLLTTQNVQNFVINTDVVVNSDQQKTLTYLSSHGVKPKGKSLALDHDTKTDQLLDSAKAAGNYEPIVAQTLQDQLSTYKNELQTAYKASTSTAAKKLLQQNFKNAEALLEQANSVVTSSSSPAS
jgi:hypothetical protein